MLHVFVDLLLKVVTAGFAHGPDDHIGADTPFDINIPIGIVDGFVARIVKLGRSDLTAGGLHQPGQGIGSGLAEPDGCKYK